MDVMLPMTPENAIKQAALAKGFIEQEQAEQIHTLDQALNLVTIDLADLVLKNMPDLSNTGNAMSAEERQRRLAILDPIFKRCKQIRDAVQALKVAIFWERSEEIPDLQEALQTKFNITTQSPEETLALYKNAHRVCTNLNNRCNYYRNSEKKRAIKRKALVFRPFDAIPQPEMSVRMLRSRIEAAPPPFPTQQAFLPATPILWEAPTPHHPALTRDFAPRHLFPHAMEEELIPPPIPGAPTSEYAPCPEKFKIVNLLNRPRHLDEL